ncbi:hypothetical protein BN938_0651 [Mucinivorans hirudinis]|uniref:Uncharacterized protein n=1 Tax=Mucinivorans hirudinis TaxID=1433126 RepID=A0A060R6N3_9BACT|nr:hypothetical protein BN938_0651 [Mucinivorans hirudinis]
MENKKLTQNEEVLVANFKVEELEKRYEMGWLSSTEVSLEAGYDNDGFNAKGTATFKF